MIRLTLVLLVAFGLVIAAVATTRGRAMKVVGDRAHGEVLFKGYCSGCHTLKAAGATARFGPNLDNLKPTYARVIHQLVTGGVQGAPLPKGARLTFGPGIHEFTNADMHDLAAFVFLATHA